MRKDFADKQAQAKERRLVQQKSAQASKQALKKSKPKESK